MHNHGITLIELLIAMAIGILLVSFLGDIYLTSIKSYELQEALRQLQNHAILAATYLQQDIKKAGHIGCAHLNSDFTVFSLLPYTISAENKLQGTDNEFFLRYMEPTNIVIKKAEEKSYLYADKENVLRRNDVLLVADCMHAEIFQVKKISNKGNIQKIVALNPLKYEYAQNAEIGKFIIKKYFIAETKRFYRDGTPVHALFLQIRQQKTELVDGITAMRIRYTVFKNGHLFSISAKSIQDWSAVVGVAIILEFFSPPFARTWYVYSGLSL